MAERDPTVLTAWLVHRVDRDAAPTTQVAIELVVRGLGERVWLLLARDTEPSLCLEDPSLDAARYVYVEADIEALYPIARGAQGWSDGIATGAVDVYGDPALVAAMPTWFRTTERVNAAVA
jgi:hypothetical protein